MNPSKRDLWVGLAMVLFAALGLWVLVGHLLPVTELYRQGSWSGVFLIRHLGYLVALVAILIVLVSGIRITFRSMNHRPESTGEVPGGLTDLYLSAVDLLRRQRWLLWLFGLVVAVNLLGTLLDFGLARHYMQNRVREFQQPGPNSPIVYDAAYVRHVIIRSLLPSVRMGLERAYPRFGIQTSTGTSVMWILAFVPAAIWAHRRLAGLIARSPEDARLRFAQNLMIPIAIVSLPTAVVLAANIAQVYAGYGRNGHFSYFPLLSVPGLAAYLLRSVVLKAFLMAGFVGSLARVTRSDHVTADSFVEDSARHWLPISGFYLLLTLVGLASGIPAELSRSTAGQGSPTHALPDVILWLSSIWNVVLLSSAFVPFAIVSSGLGARRGIAVGLRQWLAGASSAIAVAAFAIVLDAVLRLFMMAFPSSGPSYASIGGLLYSFAVSLIDVLCAAVVTLAFWMLYRRLNLNAECGMRSAE